MCRKYPSELKLVRPNRCIYQERTASEDWTEAKKIKHKAPRNWLSEEGKLYKRSHTSPYLLFIHPKAVKVLLEELHEGIYDSHTGGQTLAHRDIGGPICKEVHNGVPKNSINDKDTPQLYINLVVN